ncbi:MULTISPECIES: GFA family protein [unclassified Modicisalibacter]|uniref:GFA family protein n=1 Tax=unclassified Modicisalibacter TaxID=2679913 RepID=UPI001CCA1D0F|nr:MULTISPECIES: GFA family protein [unclassified Modicisalibacter]MBZ9560281.1 GFA family protein [Modicisalibacter sp. R2A 31.J]MBZ9576190.1 GFA family protein [Modicisalibacter sp. MOD 31.J]
MTQHSGRCLCGAVTYTINAELTMARVCWCRACQHIASNGTVNALAPTDAVSVSGELSTFTATADSGNEIQRRFCPQCGAHLFANSSGRPQFTVVRLGTLDDPSSVPPTMNIWAQNAPSWACLDPALTRIEGQPAPPRPAGQ